MMEAVAEVKRYQKPSQPLIESSHMVLINKTDYSTEDARTSIEFAGRGILTQDVTVVLKYRHEPVIAEALTPGAYRCVHSLTARPSRSFAGNHSSSR
jgi:hypothetical protein